MKKLRQLLPIIICCLLLAACTQEKKIRIGVAQCSNDDWRRKMNEEIMREAMFHDGVEVEIRSADDSNESRFSTYYIENGSYMKMKYLKLSYNLPKPMIGKIGASNVDIFGQVENVFTITKYTGLDPEILPGEYGARIDNGAYPRPRTFTLGVNIQF